MVLLVVDDDELLRQTIARRLRRCGHEVVEANSGEQAVELAKETNFDCALLDVDLPGADGLETYRQLRQTQPGITAVVLSGLLSAANRRSFMDLGVSGNCLIDKPCPLSQLQGALQSVL